MTAFPYKEIDNRLCLKLNIWQSFTHYSVCSIPILLSGLTIYKILKYHLWQTYNETVSVKELWVTLGIAIVVTIILFFWQKKALNFKEYSSSYSDKEFKEALNRTIQKLEWRILSNTSNIVQAYRPSNWTGSWGELITIVQGKDKVYFNSICDPDARASITSYGWNKKNRTTFYEHLSNVKNGIPLQPEAEESEWSLKGILRTVVQYTMAVLFIVFWILSMVKKADFSAVIVFSIGAFWALVYLVSDILILVKIRKRKSNIGNER